MASLHNVIHMSKAVIDKARERVPCTIDGNPSSQSLHYWPDWPKKDLVQHLKDLNPQSFLEFHNSRRRAIITRESPALAQLCTSVIVALASAANTASELCTWAVYSQSDPSPTQPMCREYVARAFEDIVVAFDAFGAVENNEELEKSEVMEIVWEYLRQVYETAIVLGVLSSPPNADSTFSWAREFLGDIEENGFSFCVNGNFPMVRNPTLSGVIVKEDAVPKQYLPEWSSPPVVVHNPGPYGPRLLWNGCNNE